MEESKFEKISVKAETKRRVKVTAALSGAKDYQVTDAAVRLFCDLRDAGTIEKLGVLEAAIDIDPKTLITQLVDREFKKLGKTVVQSIRNG